ncbi:hypothetical protein EV426DRAFT_579016 [Tirmania nivea]|nr:hypothetical protein EV426DRAFT_579016 [Tirmania nivea]
MWWAERITAFCLDKISRRCDFRDNSPICTTGYTDNFGDDCEDLGLLRALSATRSNSSVRSSSPNGMENELNSPREINNLLHERANNSGQTPGSKTAIDRESFSSTGAKGSGNDRSSAQYRPSITMLLNDLQIMDTTIYLNKWKSHRAVIEDEDEEDEEVEQ